MQGTGTTRKIALLTAIASAAGLSVASAALAQDDAIGFHDAADGAPPVVVDHETDIDGEEKLSFFSTGGSLHVLVADDGTWTVENGEARASIRLAGEQQSADAIAIEGGIERAGPVTQTWIDTPKGVEHTLQLEGLRGSELTVSLDVSGLRAKLDDTDVVLLVDDAGERRVQYSGLEVYDASYRRQTAWFEVTDTTIDIHVELDDDAVGPITIDPLASSPTLLAFGGTSSAGWSTATGDIDGDGHVDLLVGEPEYTNVQTKEGRAMIVWGTSSGPGFPLGNIFQSNVSYAECGRAVALADVDGDGELDVVIGCATNPTGTGLNSGHGGIQVYLNSGGGAFGSTPSLTFFDGSANFPYATMSMVAQNIDGGADTEIFAEADGTGTGNPPMLEFFKYSSGASPVQSVQLHPTINSTESLAAITLSGAEPAVAAAGNVGSLSVSISNIDDSGTGGTVVVTTSTGHSLVVGQRVIISGANVGGATYNGTYSVAQVVSSTQFRTAEVDPGSDNDPAVTTGTATGGPAAQAQIFRYDSGTGFLKTGATDVLKVPTTPIVFNSSSFSAILGAGDITGDDVSDLVIGLPFQGNQARSFKSVSGTNAWTTDLTVNGATSGCFSSCQMGSMILVADLNNDLHADAMICDPHENSGTGRCRVFGGTEDGLNTQIERISNAANGNGFTGSSGGGLFEGVGVLFGTSSAGDLFADGANDLVLARGTWGDVDYFDGDKSGLKSTNFLQITGGATNAHLGDGNTTFAVGDIDQDGVDDLVIGDGSANGASGKVFVFQGGATMSATPTLTISGSGGDILGKSVAIGHFRGPSNPPSIAVSEVEWDSSGNDNKGKVWIFNAPTNGFPTATTTAGADDSIAGSSGTNFGEAIVNCGNLVDSNGDCLAVSADLKGANGGDVYVYKANSGHTGLDHTVAATASGTSNGTAVSCSFGFGADLANAGNVENVTGDGSNRADLLVGDPSCSNGHTSEGKAFLYTGVSSGALTSSTWTFEVNQQGAAVGPVAGLGDVTGDGIDDFAVGAPLMDNVGCSIATVSDGTGSTVTVTTSAACTGVSVGQLVAVHDANVGATYNGTYTVASIGGSNTIFTMSNADPGADNDPDVHTGTMFKIVDAGRVYVFKGKSSGAPSTTQTVSMSTTFSGHCGTSIAGGVDFNRDGFMDMIEGEPSYDVGATNQGRVRVFFGKPGTMDFNPATTITGGTSNIQLGNVVGAGDLNGPVLGDVYGDIVIGAPYYTGSFGSEGEALIRIGQW